MYGPVLPRGPLTIAAWLIERGHTARVLDGYSYPAILSNYVREASGTADLVGISIHAAPALAPAMELAHRLRAADETKPIVFGGNFTRVAPDVVRSYAPSGCAVITDATDTVLEAGIAAAIERQSGPTRLFRDTSGDVRPDWSGQFLFDPLHPSFRSYLKDEDFEYHIATQDGCPFRCFHCGTGRAGLYGRTMRRPLTALEGELRTLASYCAAHGLLRPRLWISDETFISDENNAIAVCDLLESTGPWQWRAQTRVDRAGALTLARMAQVGCSMVAFGVEIPTDSGLQSLGKRESMISARQAFRATHAAGMEAQAILVVGTPDDRSSAGAIFEEIASLEADSIQAYIYHPVPGSPWWSRYGQSSPRDIEWWSSLDFHTPPITGDQSVSEVVAKFLALLVWEPERPKALGPAVALELERHSVCDCNTHAPVRVLECTPSVTTFLLESLDRFTVAVAYCNRTGQAVAAPVTQSNIYTSALFIDDPLPIDELLTEAWSLQERESGPGA